MTLSQYAKDQTPLPYGHGLWVARGLEPNHSVVHKFGHNQSVSSSYTPVCVDGVYRTPQVTSATSLRVKAGNANDTAAGTGAREVTVSGLSPTGELISEAIATAGTSASAPTTLTFIRLFRVEITASGTYASAVAGSHSADIVIEDSAGTEDWATIPVVNFPHGRSQIGVYTIPLGYTGYIRDYEVESEGNKPCDFLLFSREGVLDIAAPYSAMEVRAELVGVDGNIQDVFEYPLGPFPALTDVGWMVKGASTPEASVDFTIVLVADE